MSPDTAPHEGRVIDNVEIFGARYDKWRAKVAKQAQLRMADLAEYEHVDDTDKTLFKVCEANTLDETYEWLTACELGRGGELDLKTAAFLRFMDWITPAMSLSAAGKFFLEKICEESRAREGSWYFSW